MPSDRLPPSAPLRTGRRRPGLSLGSQLTLALAALVVLSTAVVGWLAYRTARDIIEQQALRTVGVAAASREQVLRLVLQHHHERATGFLETARQRCSGRPEPRRSGCLHVLLLAFAATERAAAVRLAFAGAEPIAIGEGAERLAALPPPAPRQLAWTGFDAAQRPYYVVRVASRRGDAELALRFPTTDLERIFLDRRGLGRSGETFLVDPSGAFVTPPRYAGQAAGRHPLDLPPMQACLAGKSGEMLAHDYRGVPVVHGFRYLAETGGGCIMAHIEEAEAFAPARALQARLLSASAAFLALALALSYALASTLSRPIGRLSEAVNAVRRGQLDQRLVPRGPRELRRLTSHVNLMASRLKRARRHEEALRERLLAATRELEANAAKLEEHVAQLEAARQRATFLADVGAELAASLDYEATLQRIARLAVPTLADRCVVDLVEADGSIRRVAVVCADPAKAPLAERLRRYSPDPHGPHPIARVARTGRAEVAADVPPGLVPAIAHDVEHARIVQELGLRSYMCVPLVARGRTLGTLWFASAESGRRYGPADLALAEELARRAALAVDNARLYREAQEAVRARDAFLARASHELRTPLTSALGTIRLLRRSRSGQLSESPETLIEIASRNLETMAALVNDLLDASKLAAGAAALIVEPVEVADLVARSLELVAAQARDKGVALETAVPAGLRLKGDPLKLEQVLVNLLANAVTFTPAGGRVRVEAERDDDGVLLRVRDTGEGIARDVLDRIFEPFFQASGGGRRRTRGTGLGLAICRQIVTLHGGRIWAESDGPGAGSTFTVRLPAAPPARAAGHAA
ncbi:MAG TPA: ATP-binding protein [Thermodesulfobacteriota bacterium]|nr:ATP-binding protein [Thermodesulfobacteriota bacterium]